MSVDWRIRRSCLENHGKSHRSAEVAVNNKKCPACGCEMKRNGRTGSGAQRWRCRCVRDELDPRQRLRRQGPPILRRMAAVEGNPARYAGSGPDLQAQDVAVLGIWPMPEVVDEIHRVVFVDAASGSPATSICRVVVLIACPSCTSCLGTSPAPRRPRLGGRCSRASRRLTWWSRTAAPGSPRQRRRSGRRRRFKDALSTRFAR